MARKKIKVLIALSISFSLLLTQVAMAATGSSGSTATATTSTVQEAAQEVEKNPQNEIKTKISKEEAIKIVKAFKFLEGYDMSNISLDNNRGSSGPVWRMNLYTIQYSSDASVSISADTGELVEYYSYQQQYSKKNIVTISKKKAREIADKFLADYIKTDTKSLEFIPNQNTYERTGGIYEIPQYDFTYALKINGIITSDANYNISINAVNGNITNFYSPNTNSEEIKYPSKDGIKDLGQLKDKYISLLNLQLQYMTSYGIDNKPGISLVYTPSISGLLDAKTNEIVEDYIYDSTGSTSQSIKYAPIIPDIKIENKEITEENAEVIFKNVKAYFENLIGIKFENNNTNMSINLNAADKEIHKNYQFRDGNENYRLSMSLNLSTGNITNLSFNQYFTDVNKVKQREVLEKVNYKAAKEISDEIIKNLFVKQYGTYSDNNQEPDSSKEFVKLQPEHSFQYIRYENEIPADNAISVSINKETGKLSRIYMNWSDIDFPEADKVISAEAAKDAYLKDTVFGLEYYTPYIYINKTGELEKVQDSV
ncbi:MAG: YcdB/YcdC domain-containing protein, partial [Ruminiclostridium sp.]